MATFETTQARRSFTRKGQATRERIVATAAELMLERGVAGTSVEDVQEAAGVSSSQLYHYFGDKQNLVREVIAFQNQALLAEQQPLLDNLGSMDALRSWRNLLVQTAEDLGCKGGCPIGTLAGELAEAYPDCRLDLALCYASWEEAIRKGLREMYDHGALKRSADPDRLALALLAAVQGGMTIAQVRRDTTPLQVSLDTTLDYIASLQPRRRPISSSA
jgi:TetR/AcrR family transcriptional regulator, transcriptional repressor for nem operon